jgi:hypothetical protein
MSRHALLKASRLVHLYFGVFITPALIFFAFTGAIQTFGLHETNRDHPTYVPARWLVVLGQIHKKQTPIVRKPQPPTAAAPVGEAGEKHDHQKPAEGVAASATEASKPPATPPAAPPAAPQKKPRPLPLRIFFLVVAIGLLTSTVTGLYMSYKFIRNKALITATLVAGIIIPLLLTLL